MKHYHFLPIALIVMLTGCSSAPPSTILEEARNEYRAAQSNSQVVNLAPGELKQAGNAIDKANEASRQNKDQAEIDHLAYIAKQRVGIARATARQNTAEATVASAGMKRSADRLEARTEEADRAQQSADESQRDAAISRQEAARSQKQADMSQQQTREAQMRTSELEAELEELNAKKTERGMVITLGDVLFNTNKANLRSGSTRTMQKLATFLKKHPQRMVLIEGYTDSTGTAEYNLGLSKRRANSVQSALMNMGISKDRISTQGYGLKSPVASNATAIGRQMNRRVEIVLPDNDIATR